MYRRLLVTRPDGSFTGSARRLKRDIDRRMTNQLGQAIAFADRGRDEQGNRLNTSARHQPGGAREEFLNYAVGGGQ